MKNKISLQSVKILLTGSKWTVFHVGGANASFRSGQAMVNYCNMNHCLVENKTCLIQSLADQLISFNPSEHFPVA